MGTLVSTEYSIVSGNVVLVINYFVQSQSYQITCSASENQLLALAQTAGRIDWNTDDCKTFASQTLGLPVN